MSLKRSFEVEEVDQPSNSSTPQRRTPNTLVRSTVSSSTQKFQDLGTRNSDTLSRHGESPTQRSPKSSLKRVELSGPKHPEPVSRRTEISIDISSKQVENSPSGSSRFGLKRADVLGHKPPETAPRRTEINIGKPQDQALRRMDVPSKIPEPTQRRGEATSSPVPDVATKRVEIQVAKSSEVPVTPARSAENVELSSTNPYLPPEQKPQPAMMDIPPKSQEVYEEQGLGLLEFEGLDQVMERRKLGNLEETSGRNSIPKGRSLVMGNALNGAMPDFSSDKQAEQNIQKPLH
ncbi:hypothetical protein lerEdw1_017866 [Lerista edwardsae]|nr:hypothetical protein lerEdw1_017866 [Lerista edwardsae]